MPKRIINHLIPHYSDQYKYEICIDECARGTLCYSTCIGAIVLSRDLIDFCMDDIKDSKKFSSKTKLKQVAEYITNHSCILSHNICTIDAVEIDRINILQAVFKGMHECIHVILQELDTIEKSQCRKLNVFEDVLIIVDGDKFKPYCMYDKNSESMREIPHITIEQGDSKYVGVACASIIAKNHHDDLIWELCKQYPELDTRYDLSKNVGYGTKKHLDGIKTHGISQWHRRTFGICKISPLNPVSKHDTE
jgi:ribonuclease HII